MRTLLIVDDERNIRVGLKAMIEREFPDRYRIELAADGKQATELHEAVPFDIVITDIRMPEMDGIELIRTLAIRPYVPAMLILSGYDDFQYAKEAIKHKVKEYLLKPIVREDLFAALGRIESELAQQASIHDRLEATDRYLEGMQVNALGYVWARSDIGSAEVEARCRDAGLDIFEPCFYVGILSSPEYERNVVKGKELLARGGSEGDCLTLENKDGRLVVLTTRMERFRDMVADLATFPGSAGTFAAGISDRGQSLLELKIKFDEACHALKYRILLSRSDSALIRFEQSERRDRTYRLSEDTIRKLANMLGTDRDKEMKALLMELFNPKALAEADIGYFESVSLALNERVFDQAFHTYGEASVDIIKMYKLAGSLYNFMNIQDYIHCVEGLLLRLSEYARGVKSVYVDQKEMARALAYIHTHFDKDLSMTVVSNHVSLNYSYFSERFKEYTGESFVNYLKKIRIQKAKVLLAETDGRIYEISRQVGFENPKQFNRVFREIEGITAMEYRQKQL
ncbi:response regulator [Cohnella endophytica]|uniref:Response regulator n=1 Tax=Cohnella endophytica TaxID=2419778 RepID=A0A494XE05_9BACL|nr:response regulator [Cohnella endophytica]RKP46696.1 response regulator [Cohnella endophytica]